MVEKAIVFGGSGDIGSAIAEILRQTDLEVVIPSRGECDFLSQSSVSDFLGSIQFTPKHLIFAAGINEPSTLLTLDRLKFEDALKVNFQSIVAITTYFAEAQSSIMGSSNVALSSLYAERGRLGRSSYSASKAALEAFFRSLAIEFGPKGVRYNILRPGFIGTSLTHRNNSETEVQQMIGRIPMGRLGTAMEIASVVKFLLSQESGYVNGSIITVDGGFSAQS